MDVHSIRHRPWVLVLFAILLFGAHAMLFRFLWHGGLKHTAISGVLVSGFVVVLIAKHLGIFGAVLGSLYARFRSHNRK